MRVPPSFLEEIKARLPVSEVVRRRVKLVKAGREWKGLSPFNSEKSPSFFVNDQKQAWFDFSSGQNGSIFDFLMKTEGIAFPEAVERLAAMAGLQMPTVTPEAEQREKRRTTLVEACELAARFFEEQLQARAGAKARGYLQDRGVQGATQKEFRLGYAPNEKFALRDWLASKDVPVEVMTEAGLLIHGEDIAVPYDRFRDRVMFPIEDARGRVVAFGGRAMEKDVPAKYLNSPETPLFHKGAMLYNHHRARKAAHDAGSVVSVEGYVDVIALWQAGFPYAVAGLGTALTAEQCELLWRMSARPTLCFDGDKAGRKAANRAIDTALPMIGPEKTFRFALLPQGQDPDDLIRAEGPEAMGEALQRAQPLVDLLWTREVEAAGDLATPESRAALERRLDEAVRPIPDEALRRHYREELRRRLDALFGRAPSGGGQGRPRQGGGRAAPQGRQGRFAPGPPRGYLDSPLAFGAGLVGSALLKPSGAPPREVLICAALTAHPELLHERIEEVASLEFSGADVRRLVAAMLALAHEPLDRPGLIVALDEIGLGEERGRIETDPRLLPIPAVRPGADPQEAARTLDQAIAMHRRQVALGKELREAQAALAAETSEPNFAWLAAVKAQIAALEAAQQAQDDDVAG